MNNFTVRETPIKDLLLISSRVFNDDRGFFLESFNERSFKELGIQAAFVQDNRSKSVRGTLRGLHFQKTHPQGKLVNVISGEVFDVAVDLRRQSSTFGKWFGVRLTGEDGLSFYVPPGFAHGFYVISESAHFMYKCTDFYMPHDESGLLWNDPSVGIEWPLVEKTSPVLAEKDLTHPGLSECFRFDM